MLSSIITRAVFHLRFSTWCPHIGVEGGPELPELVSQRKVLPLIGSDTFDFLSLWHSLTARANAPGNPMLHSYVGCCSVRFMVSGPGSRDQGMRGGGTVEGKQLLLSRQVRWSPEERQQNGQASRKRRPEASRPGVIESIQAASQASPFVPPLGHTPLPSPTQPVPTVWPG